MPEEIKTRGGLRARAFASKLQTDLLGDQLYPGFETNRVDHTLDRYAPEGAILRLSSYREQRNIGRNYNSGDVVYLTKDGKFLPPRRDAAAKLKIESSGKSLELEVSEGFTIEIHEGERVIGMKFQKTKDNDGPYKDRVYGVILFDPNGKKLPSYNSFFDIYYNPLRLNNINEELTSHGRVAKRL